MHILLIEDNEDDVEIIRHSFSQSGEETWTLHWVNTLHAGLALLDNGRIDVVLLDLSLPDSHGVETFTHVHRCAPFMPVVVLTGLEDERLGLQMVENGAQDYLVKRQLDAKLLSRSLRYAMERSRNEHTIRTYAQELQAKNQDLAIARDKAVEADQVKARFLATISHEFRTPRMA